ncbi:MAG: PBP1A family penicillin-binding protein [Raoultibacter sp.]
MASRASKNRAGKKTKQPFIGLLVFFAIVISVVATGGIAAYALGTSWLQDLPDYEDSAAFNTAEKTRVYAGDDTTLLAEFYLENREPVTAAEISPFVFKGTVATEDERFYDHGGIDMKGIARAVVANLTGSSEGASTITQQFVRNTVLSDEMNDITFKRKVREMYIAVKLEEKYTKDEILLMYLNTINYGSGAYGIQAASQQYFSKNALDLTLVEAATLVGIPQSPNALNPIDNPQACLERRNVVLNRMLSNNYITQADYDAAIAQEIVLNVKPQDQGEGMYLYPYFTSYVRQLLLEKYSDAEVFKGGMTVYTTIDPATQDAAERAAANKRAEIADDLEVALTAVDPATGYIKALVGGSDYYANKFNLATQGMRQPGSSFKTFTLASAIENGIAPTTSLDCSSPVKIGSWEVENYNGAQYGTRPLSSAFAVSSNTGFARLVTYLGPEKVADIAHRMGIKSDLNAVPSITLGGEAVTVKEMAGAYATIASEGTQRDAVAIRKIIDRKGAVLEQANTTGTKAISPEVACATRKVMEGVVTGGTGTAARLANGQPVAGKTGTSENWRDSWFCGVTPQMSVAIWVGAVQERQMPESVTATSVFSDFMNQVLEGQPVKQFPTAKDPAYKPVYDASLHIGAGSGSGSSDSSGSGDSGTAQPAPEAKPETPATPAPTPTPTPDPTPKPDPEPTPTPDPKPDPGPDPGGGGSATTASAAFMVSSSYGIARFQGYVS